MSERLQSSLVRLKEDFEQRQLNSKKQETIQMREHLEARLAALREAFAQGEANFQNLEAQKAQQRDDLLRIDGAISILVETIQVLDDKEKVQVGKAEPATATGA